MGVTNSLCLALEPLASDTMARSKKAKPTKHCEEDEEKKLVEIYTNKNFEAPAVKSLERIDEESTSQGEGTPEASTGKAISQPRPRRAAAAAAKSSLAPKEVRKLEFVPYHVSDKERDKRRRQRAVTMSKSKGKKPVKWQGITEEQEDQLAKLIADGISEEEDTDDDDNIINRAIDKVLMKGKAAAAVGAAANDPLPPLTTGSAPSVTASASKRVNTKRRRSSAVFVRPSFQFPEFDEEPELMTAGGSGGVTAADCATAAEEESNSRRTSFELAIQEADLMFGPIDDGSRPEETGETTEPKLPKLEDTKVYQRVRRSSRFFRASGGGGPSLSCSGSEEPSGSVFTEVAILPKKDRRKSRRTFLAISAHPDGQENAGKGSNSEGGAKGLTNPNQPQIRSPLSPIDNLLTALPRNA